MQAWGVARLMLRRLIDDKGSMAKHEAKHAGQRAPVSMPAADGCLGIADSLFEPRLTALSRFALAASLEGLVSVLREAQPEHLQCAVLEAKMVSETSFFRDDQPFEALRTQVLPRLVASRRPERRLRLWSAACSTGQEAYSLALLLVHGFAELADWDVQIIGTDISADAIAYARSGVYKRCETERGLPRAMRNQRFDRVGETFQVCNEVRRLCKFHVADLGGTLPEMPVFDLILLRNVLFYLPPGERTCVFRMAHGKLWRRGFLILGDAEQAEDSTKLFELEGGPASHFYRPVGSP